MAQVELKNVVGRYGEFLAVDDVSFTIPSGAFVTLLGPSGCGKTSTLRIVAGLLQPTAGRVEFDGRNVNGVSAAKRNIGMVFQSLALFPHLTVEENVAFGLKMKKVPAAEIDRQVRRMLEIVRLGHLADRYPAQMSGGQRQRVALARALAITPSILILDEPFGALDRKLREAMQVELHDLTRELGITALFVTHDQEEALMLSDAIGVMNKGRIEQFGTPAEIYGSPGTAFVADFMGMTNFLSGRLVAADRSATRIEVAGRIVTGPPRSDLSIGQDVTLAVRPEKIAVMGSNPEGEPPNGALSGKVRQVTYHGNALRYVVEAEAGASIVSVDSGGTGATAIAPGSSVWLRWRTEDVYLFLP
jgi:spermidine/putrescine ABC transporter ATP-binding subunit